MDAFDLRKWPGYVAAGGNLANEALIHQVTVDSRRVEGPGSLFVALPGEKTDGHHFVSQAANWGAKFALVSSQYDQNPEGIKLLRVEDPLAAFQEIAKAYRDTLKAKIIAITGSYGKTMAKDLLKELLKAKFQVAASPESFNSQIGVPLSLFTFSKDHEVGIIEAAVSKLAEMDKLAQVIRPDVCVLTHTGQKHMHTFGSVSNMLAEYFTLVKKVKKPFVPWLPELASYFEGLEAHFWNRAEAGLPFATLIAEGQGLSLPYQIHFPDGSSYQGNITSGFYYYLDLINICVKLAWNFGVEAHQITQTLSTYKLEPSRTEIWKSPTGLTLVNDTYSEDPQSVEKAFRFLEQTTGKGRKIFLFGGLKGHPTQNDYKHVGSIIAKANIDTLFLSGDEKMSAPITEIVAQASPATSIMKTETPIEALQIIKSTLLQDDIVLIKGKKKEPLEMLMETFHESPCTNLSIINLAAIEENIKSIRSRLAPHARIMVIVKAFGYGTDDFRMAKFLKSCGIDILGVSYVEEGVSLKRGGVAQSIFVLNAADYEIPKVVKWDLEVGVSTLKTIHLLGEEAKKAGKIIKVHLHIDTGMGRFGCLPEDALKLAHAIEKHSSLVLEGIMTHFASSEDPNEDSFTFQQAKQLEEAVVELKQHGIEAPYSHAANSAAILRHSFPQFNMARPGLAIYGLYPSPSSKIGDGLRPAISLISRIAGINHCKKGGTVSYGRTYLVEKEMQKIAVLPIGYFDGLHRQYSGKGYVLIRGQKAPMVGRICMDFMMVDVTEIEGVQEGDPVLIFGEDDYGDYLSPEDVAYKGDSIAHELITCLGPRIQRVFIYEESHKKGKNNDACQ